MCDAVRFQLGQEILSVNFTQPAARLPVRMRDGSVRLFPWGRRSKQPGKLPLGGHASLDAIHSGAWDRFFPKPVKIPHLAFMEKDFENRSNWYDNGMPTARFIQGLLAREGAEVRVYIVVLKPGAEVSYYHETWPRIV